MTVAVERHALAEFQSAALHHFGSAISVRTSFHLFQVLFGRRLTLPLALYPFLLSFLGILQKLLLL